MHSAQFRFALFHCLHSPNPSSQEYPSASKLAAVISALPAVLIVYQNLFLYEVFKVQIISASRNLFDCLFHQSLEISILMNLRFYETFGSMKSLITGKTVLLLFYSGSHLLSHAVSNIVSSAA